jgi:CheY-like chemotaxis protein
VSLKPTVFLVEDDARSLRALSALLHSMGIRYTRNTTGALVVEQIRATRPRPDFILLNVDLPDGDAFAIYQEILADPVLGQIPVIALTDTQILPDILAQIQSHSFAGTLHKPVSQPVLERLLEAVSSRSAGHAG